MKEKILLLISTRLANITHENIFFVNQRYTPNLQLGNPVVDNVNYQRVLVGEYRDSNLERTRIDTLTFELIFEDGEPNVVVGADCYTTITKNETVEKRFFRKNIVTEVEERHYNFKTFVKVGHVKIVLKDKEAQDLMDATKKAYKLHLELRKDYDDEMVMQKLDLRLKS
jgi:hypothetical protein